MANLLKKKQKKGKKENDIFFYLFKFNVCFISNDVFNNLVL